MAFNVANFARMPESKIGHSKFDRPNVLAGTCMHGKAVPIYCKLVSPGEVIKEKIYGNVRMSTPIAPIYSSIKISFNAFFIPLRLVWEHTEEFFKTNKTSAGPQLVDYKIPMANFNTPSTSSVKVHSVSHYLGKPLYKGATLETGAYYQKASILKERAYWLTISEWYRMEQVQNPIQIIKNDTGSIANENGVYKNVSSECASVLKDFDYFTTCTRSPQYGPDVILPLGSVAPLTTGSMYELPSAIKVNAGNDGTTRALVKDAYDQVSLDISNPIASSTQLLAATKTNLYADLSSATAASIDELYLAMAAQAWYHNANYGSRYFEMLQIHYSVTNPDLVLQRPEHIGEAKRYIRVQQVLSTAGAATDDTTKLGQPGANSSTDIEVEFPRHSFGEWGYFMVIASTYHERYYPAGIQREDLYEDMFDFFFPEFSNIGDMAVLKKELFSASSLDPEDVFGFQEAWSEMRYTPNRVTGLFDPYVNASNGITGHSNPIKGWVLSEKWNGAPSLSSEFLTEDREAIKDALVTGANGPDYIFYYYFDETTLSEVPVYSKPGLPGRGRGII